MKKINPKIRALLQANSILFFECFEYSNWQKKPSRQHNFFGTDIWILKIDLLFFPFSGWMDKSSLVISFGSINTFAISMPIIFTCQSTTFHLRSSYNGIVGGDCISCSNIYSCLVSHLLIFFSDKIRTEFSVHLNYGFRILSIVNRAFIFIKSMRKI